VEVEAFADELLEGGEEEVEAFFGGDAGEEEEEGAIRRKVIFFSQLLRQFLVLQGGEGDADGEDEVFGVVAKAFGGLLFFSTGEVEGRCTADVGGFEEGGVEFFGEGFLLEVGGVEGAEGAEDVGEVSFAASFSGDAAEGGEEGVDVGDVVLVGVGFEPGDEGGGVFVAFEGGAGVVADVVAVLLDGLI